MVNKNEEKASRVQDQEGVKQRGEWLDQGVTVWLPGSIKAGIEGCGCGFSGITIIYV